MAKNILNVTKRDAKTDKPRRVRKQGMIPAIVYGKGVAAATEILVSAMDFFKLFRGDVKENVLIELAFKGEDAVKTVLVKDFQRNPLRDEFLHVDFIEVHAGEKLTTNVPIHLKGKAVGIAKGGILEHSLRELHIECLPADLPTEITVDISSLDVGHAVHVRDLPISPNVRVLAQPDTTVAAVTVPKKVEETPAAGAEAVEGAPASAEPELIKKEKPEGAAEAKDDAKAKKEDAKPKKEKDKK